MAKLLGLQKHQRTGMYWIRRVVPPELREIVGRREITRTLETKDPREAKRRYSKVAAIIEGIFDQARAQIANAAFYRKQLEAGDEAADRQAAFEAGLTEEQRELLYRLERRAAKGNPVEIGADEIDTLISLPDEAIPLGAHEVTPKAQRKGQPHLDLEGLLGLWAMDTQATEVIQYNWGKTVGKLDAYLRDNGKPTTAERVRRKDVIDWRDHLLTVEGKAPKTVELSLSILRTIYRNAILNERLKRQDNPAADIRIGVKQGPLDKVRPYTDTEAKAVLEAARQQGPAELHWLPMLTFACGLRINEAAGLRVDDVRDDPEAGPYVRLEDHAARTLKNASSNRNVPIPHWVVQEGFLKYAKKQARSGALGNDLLFPMIVPDAKGHMSGNLTRRWGKVVRNKARIKDKRIQPAHSARHWYSDKLREAGIEREVRDRLLGHSTPGVGSGYGAGYSLAALREAVDAIRWPF